ncbi:hypothetical protein H0H93_009299 [Arthromyces matolae]|nr:hypothetical protein H0H93_009299 [Arthromyces matolae]
MKKIIYHGLAVSFIGTVLLICASPIALNASSIIQRSPLASPPDSNGINAHRSSEQALRELIPFPNRHLLISLNLDTELINPDGLTRRAPPVPTPFSHLEYTTPLAFMDSLEESHSRARGHEIKLWQKRGVNDLEQRVDSLTAFGNPTWLWWECYDQIKTADDQISTFIKKEYEGTSESHAIKQYEYHLHRVNTKLYEIDPGRPSVEDVKKHAEARRKRIEEWGKGDQVTALKKRVESLPRFGFPNWLVSACFQEIYDTLELVEEFKKEEKEKNSLDTITKHETAIRQVQRDLTGSWNRDFGERLRQLLPKIREGGAWRKLIKNLVDAALEDPHMYWQEDLRNHTELYIHAGFEIIKEIMEHGPGQEIKVEMNRFRGFLRRQWHRRGNGRPDSGSVNNYSMTASDS